jgi:RNA polymerase sigma factor (sigma-70 family)
MSINSKDQTLWFEANLEPHLPLLRSWIESRFNSKSEAQDIVQEALLRVLKVQRTRDIESPKAFLFATAKNEALMRLRKDKVRNLVDLAEFEDLDIFIDESVDLTAEISRNEELEMLTKAIQSLPTRCRQIFTLRKIYRMSQKQIASQLEISENTVETQIGIGTHKISDYFDLHEIR